MADDLVWSTNSYFDYSGGWTYTVPYFSSTVQTATYGTAQNPYFAQCNYNDGFQFFDSNGTANPLHMSDDMDCGNAIQDNNLIGANIFYQAQLKGAPPIVDAHGTVYTFSGPSHYDSFHTNYALVSTIEDTNGNMIGVQDNAPSATTSGAFTYTDTLERPVLSTSGFGSGQTTIAVAGFMNPYKVQWEQTPYDFSPGYTKLLAGGLGPGDLSNPDEGATGPSQLGTGDDNTTTGM